jgi:hypothetical protein
MNWQQARSSKIWATCTFAATATRGGGFTALRAGAFQERKTPTARPDRCVPAVALASQTLREPPNFIRTLRRAETAGLRSPAEIECNLAAWRFPGQYDIASITWSGRDAVTNRLVFP